ncbi:hypothetical protein Sjap_005762 [Stephania japonica]|uniref:Uncharacterized protein n=1 Tax=Stephania japonica TaxID=461633 RepID=A0AAP0K663_9MAGN
MFKEKVEVSTRTSQIANMKSDKFKTAHTRTQGPERQDHKLYKSCKLYKSHFYKPMH